MQKEVDPPKTNKYAQFFENLKQPEFTQNLETNPQIQYIDPDLRDTDKGNVIRILNRYRNDILYTKGLGFLIWNGKHWEADGQHLLHTMIAEIHGEMLSEVEAISDKKERKEFLSWVRSSNNQSGIKNAMNYLKDSGEIRTVEEIFDDNDWLLNFQNGTLDLKTGELRDFKRSDYLTKCLPYDFDPEAQCPRWEQFLNEILDPDEVPWIKRVIGYTLTGDASAQMFMFLSGTGRNGKGRLLQTLLKVLGPYSRSLPPNSIMQRYGGEGIPNDIATLKGARLIVVPEVPDGKRWNEELLKRLTGEDVVTARFLNKEFFDFKCKGKLWISGNTQPTVSDSGISFWERLKLLQFKKSFAANPDVNLGKKLEKELSGILNWALEGLQECLTIGLKEGLKEPESVKAQTLQYRSDNDSISRFIEDSCQMNKDFSIQSAKLYRAYQAWSEDQGEAKSTMTLTKFGRRLVELNYAKKKATEGMMILGLTLHETLHNEEDKDDEKHSKYHY